MELQFKPEFLATFDEKLREHGYPSTAIADEINRLLENTGERTFSSALRCGMFFIDSEILVGLHPESPCCRVKIDTIKESDCANWKEYFCYRLERARKGPFYKIKNKAIERMLFDLFGEEAVLKIITKQMADQHQTIYFGNKSYSSLKAELRDGWRNLEPMGIEISLPKTEIETLLKFDPYIWNPFPVVQPPEAKRYLVQIDDPKKHGPITLVKNWTFSQTWKKLRVVAFRELPAPYVISKPKDEETW